MRIRRDFSNPYKVIIRKNTISIIIRQTTPAFIASLSKTIHTETSHRNRYSFFLGNPYTHAGIKTDLLSKFHAISMRDGFLLDSIPPNRI